MVSLKELLLAKKTAFLSPKGAILGNLGHKKVTMIITMMMMMMMVMMTMMVKR